MKMTQTQDPRPSTRARPTEAIGYITAHGSPMLRQAPTITPNAPSCSQKGFGSHGIGNYSC